MTDLRQNFQYMALAVFVAYRALKNGETPVACVFVNEITGAILSFGCNDTNRSLNGTRHAEFVAVDKIFEENHLFGCTSEKVRAFFEHVTLYVTIEPCVMCALALEQIGVRKVFFGASNDRFGGNGTVLKVQKDSSYLAIGGIMRVEAIHLLRNFYIQENLLAPVPKSKKNKDIDGKGFPDNLTFSRYLSSEEFIKQFGLERFDQFYPGPSQDRELTPRWQTGYTLAYVLSREIIMGIPSLESLYPCASVTIEEDVHALEVMLPRITADGTVMWATELEHKKRKLEDGLISA